MGIARSIWPRSKEKMSIEVIPEEKSKLIEILVKNQSIKGT